MAISNIFVMKRRNSFITPLFPLRLEALVVTRLLRIGDYSRDAYSCGGLVF